MAEQHINLIGVRVGRLTVAKESPKKRRGEGKGFRRYWECVCDCGSVVSISQDRLRLSEGSKSCGCLQRESAYLAGKSNRIHGESTHAGNTTEYRIWCGIVQRCCNPNDAAYEDYGGRGITMCPRWRESYVNFLKDLLSEIGRRPSIKLTIDRINNDRGYEPGNIRWATKTQQVQNSRSARLLTFKDEVHSVTEWSTITKISRHALFNRLRDGWTVERTLTTPMRGSGEK